MEVPKSGLQKLLNAFPARLIKASNVNNKESIEGLTWGDAMMLNEVLTDSEINNGVRNRNLGRLFEMAAARRYSPENVAANLAAAQAAQADANARMDAYTNSRATRTWVRNNNNGNNNATRKLKKVLEENAKNTAKKDEAKAALNEAKAALKEAKAARSQVVSGMTQNQKETAIRSILSSNDDYRTKQTKLIKQIPHMSSRIAKGLTAPGANIGRSLKDLKKAENKAATGTGSAAAAVAAESEAIANVLNGSAFLPSQEDIQTYYATKLSEKEQGGRRRTRRRRSSRRKSMKKRV
jgi:hypothetical protein